MPLNKKHGSSIENYPKQACLCSATYAQAINEDLFVLANDTASLGDYSLLGLSIC